MCCVLGLEESILLKWPYYPRQSTDSLWSLSKYQWHFLHKILKLLMFWPMNSLLNHLKKSWKKWIVVQSLTCVQLLATSWTAAHQASLSFIISLSLLKLMSIESVISSSHLILCHPFLLCPQSWPASGSFPKNWLFPSGDQSTGASASASVLPMNIQGWVSFRIDWFNLLAVQESSPAPQFESISCSARSSLYAPLLTSVHDHWENRTFDHPGLCWQSDVSAL